MRPHGQDMFAASPSSVAERRRFTLSVIVSGGPAMAKRLVGWLKWRGFVFDRIVVKPDGEGEDVTRIVLTITTTQDRSRSLVDSIGRYAPVRALRQFYAAPVVDPRPNTQADGLAKKRAADLVPEALCEYA